MEKYNQIFLYNFLTSPIYLKIIWFIKVFKYTTLKKYIND